MSELAPLKYTCGNCQALGKQRSRQHGIPNSGYSRKLHLCGCLSFALARSLEVRLQASRSVEWVENCTGSTA